MILPLTRHLLSTWEQGRDLPSARRGLMLLTAACPGSPVEELARLSVGQRDRRLLGLRESLFGSRVVGRATCPECGQPVELAFEIADVRVEGGAEAAATRSVEVGEWSVVFRLPDSRDLARVESTEDVESARRMLLEECVVESRQSGSADPVGDLPHEVQVAVVKGMAEADPQADVRLLLSCPQCDHGWQEVFDIVSFLWSELDAWARRALREVHALASAYGWSESEILAMGPSRRRAYLAMASG